MKIFAIADLHLSMGVEKPMDIFGAQWANHQERLRENWVSSVGSEDLVLLPGDLSWGLRPEEARPDLDFICSLPGRKLILKGNHDLWWNSATRVRAMLFGGADVLQNEAMVFGGFAIAGTRGWEKNLAEDSDDGKVYRRELLRLQLSLSKAPKDKRLIVMMHYPPLLQDGASTPMTDILEQYGPELTVYGHLHGAAHKSAFNGTKNGIRYQLVAGDYLNFQPLLIAEE